MLESLSEEVTLTVVLMDRSKSRQVLGKAKLSQSVWRFGDAVGMATLSTHDKSKGGYIFRRQGGESYKSNRYPELTLADVGVRDGDTVEFAGDFDPFEPESADTEARASQHVSSLHSFLAGLALHQLELVNCCIVVQHVGVSL